MKGTGWRKDPADPRDRKAAALFGEPDVTGLPVSADISHHVAEVYDQKGTSSCVAQSVAQAVRIAMATQTGLRPESASRRAIYFWARATHNEQGDDAGTYVRAAFYAMSKLGYPPESVFPFSEPGINEAPPLEVYRRAADQKFVSGYSRIPDGHRAPAYIKAALAAGHPVVFGTLLDDDFPRIKDGRIWRRQGPVIGGHAMCCIGYDAEGIRVVNSWGTGWGEGGYGRIAWSQVENPQESNDFWVVQVAPAFGGPS